MALVNDTLLQGVMRVVLMEKPVALAQMCGITFVASDSIKLLMLLRAVLEAVDPPPSTNWTRDW